MIQFSLDICLKVAVLGTKRWQKTADGCDPRSKRVCWAEKQMVKVKGRGTADRGTVMEVRWGMAD